LDAYQTTSMYDAHCMMRIGSLDMASNDHILTAAGTGKMTEILRGHQIRWLGRAGRMGAERWPKQAMIACEVPDR
jgi:hypothetical protein